MCASINDVLFVCCVQYIDEPSETKMDGGIRAQVHAIYEPPQEGLPTGVRFLRDPNEKIVHEVNTCSPLTPPLCAPLSAELS